MATSLSCLYTNIYAGETLQFSDESDDSPATWHWERNSGGGWADFAGSPTSENPTETFSTAGTYSIRLTTDKGTVTKTNFITVAATPSTDYYPTDDTATNTDHDAIPNLLKASLVTDLLDSGGTVNASSLTLSDGDVIGVCYGTTLVWDIESTTRLKGIGVAGVLKFSRSVNTKLMCQHLYVYKEGILDRGTVYDPIENVTSRIIGLDVAIDRGTPDDLGEDPESFGNGLIVWGRYRSHGKTLNKTFIRLATEILATDTTLTLSEAAADWAVGDEIAVPESRMFNINNVGDTAGSHHWESRTISSKNGANTVLTMNSAFTYDHPCAREADGSVAYSTVFPNTSSLYNVPMIPHAANLTRTVRIESENGAGTRWHTMYTHRADIDIRYTAHVELGRTTLDTVRPSAVRTALQPPGWDNFSNTTPIVFTSNTLYAPSAWLLDGEQVFFEDVAGNTAANGLWEINQTGERTWELVGSVGNGAYTGGAKVTRLGPNQKGRYATHVHHLCGPIGGQANGHAFTMTGNSFHDPYPAPGNWQTAPRTKWDITIHGSSYGLINKNVIHHTGGAGVMLESGGEKENLFEGNICMNIHGRESQRTGTADNDVEQTGRSGVAYFMVGSQNRFRNNVGCGCVDAAGGIGAGSVMYAYLIPTTMNVTMPDFLGADPMDDGTVIDLKGTAILEWESNEAYGGIAWGATVWNFEKNQQVNLSVAKTTVKNLLVWHAFELGWFGYPTDNFGFDGFEVVADRSLVVAGASYSGGFSWGDYFAGRAFVKNFSLRNVYLGTEDCLALGESTMTVENGYILAYHHGIRISTARTPGSGVNIKEHEFVFRNVTVEQTGSYGSFAKILMVYISDQSRTNMRAKEKVTVEDWGGTSGLNFQVYYTQQAADFVMPQSINTTPYDFRACPEAGLTNAQAYVKYHEDHDTYDATLKVPTGSLSDSEGCCVAGYIMPANAETRSDVSGGKVVYTSEAGENTPIAKSRLALAVGTGRLLIGVG